MKGGKGGLDSGVDMVVGLVVVVVIGVDGG